MDRRTENDRERMFNKDWEVLYFMSEQDGKPVCLLCFDTMYISICKLYNVKRHYYSLISLHKDNDEKFPIQSPERSERVIFLKTQRNNQQKV